LTSSAAFEAINKFDGDANGIMFKPKEASTTLNSSINDAMLVIILGLTMDMPIFRPTP
jgi:hypothetical protein